jgi:hypothetical protein
MPSSWRPTSPNCRRWKDRRADLRLELDDPEGDDTGDDAPHTAKAVIDVYVRRTNGFGRLRWGRAFAEVEISGLRTVDAAGRETQMVFPGTAQAYLPWEQFADMVEQLGYSRPEKPVGLDAIDALDGEAVVALAEANPAVARVLRLVELMLMGDDEIDWVAGYSALETIEQDLADRGLNARELGCWSRSERRRFDATANSPEVLGTRARHGKRSGLTEARMTSNDASWLVRRAAALWLKHRLEEGDGSEEHQAEPDAAGE